jgi:NADH:ubiquinone oxidoreductase subunit K
MAMLVLSAVLLGIGVFGLIVFPGIIRAFIALESIIIAGILNFANTLHGRFVWDVYIVILLAVTVSCLTFCLIFVNLNLRLKSGRSADILNSRK